jgi:hypothetical protein
MESLPSVAGRTKESAMLKRTVLLLSVLALILGATACRPLPEPRPTARGALQTEDISYTDAIPLDYGTFIGVASLPDNPYCTGLWFEKPDKTIVFVKVNVSLGKIEKQALLLPRR